MDQDGSNFTAKLIRQEVWKQEIGHNFLMYSQVCGKIWPRLDLCAAVHHVQNILPCRNLKDLTNTVWLWVCDRELPFQLLIFVYLFFSIMQMFANSHA